MFEQKLHILIGSHNSNANIEYDNFQKDFSSV